MTIIDNLTAADDYHQHLETLTTACSSWFVRQHYKFYDVNRLNSALSRDDVEMMILNRIKQEYPDIQLSNELIKALFTSLFDARQTDMQRSIQVWNGLCACHPETERKLIPMNGAMAVNAWSLPEYRKLSTNAADMGVVDELFEAVFKTEDAKNDFLDWVAWNLQNEEKKPTWAPFLYSRHKGTGKSTIGRVLRELFGSDNTVTQNNVDKLTQRFNATVLRSKLVICEETHLRPGSSQVNAIKTYLTEGQLLIEPKGREAETVRNVSCFVFTSNHLPNWFETGERRYLVFDVDHDGRTGGPSQDQFVRLVGAVHQFLDEPRNVASLYNALLRRTLPEDFSAMSLNLQKYNSPIMQRLADSSRQTIVDRLEECLNEYELVALPEASVAHLVRKELGASINQTKHLMDDLEWQKQKVKWGGRDYARAIWLRDGFYIHNGYIHGPDFEPARVDDYLEKHLPEVDVEVLS